MQDLQPLKALLDEMGCAYLEEEPMCDHTTFKIGGPADLFVKPASLQAACRVVEACREMEIPLLPVGGGSIPEAWVRLTLTVAVCSAVPPG